MKSAHRDDAPYQPELRRRDSAWRYLVVGLMVAVQFGAVGATADWWSALNMVVTLAAVMAVFFRRRWPLPVASLTVALAAISMGAVGPMMLATVSLATRRRWREIAVFAALAAASYTAMWRFTGWSIVVNADTVSFTSASGWYMGYLAILVGWGLYIGSRRELLWTLRERADRLEREQETLTQQARDAERAQIAREMHDVLAHRISQISMQAGAIAFRTDLDADELRASAQQLHSSANAALDDLRVVLGVLRDPGSAGPLDSPQPKATDIDAMVAAALADGMRIRYHSDIQPDVGPGLDDTIGRTLYRIAQECITNARKHATGTTLTIDITGSPNAGVDLVASNPLPIGPAPSGLPRSGFGLIGLAERAELAGGSLTTERNHHSFTVTCHLPWQPQPAARPHEYAR